MPAHHLEIKDLTVAYHRVPAVHHVTLDLRCGHCIALLGPNGAGKTTFFKALVGLVPKGTGGFGHATNQRAFRWATTARLSRAIARARSPRFSARRTVYRARQNRAGFARPGDSQTRRGRKSRHRLASRFEIGAGTFRSGDFPQRRADRVWRYWRSFQRGKYRAHLSHPGFF